MSFFLTFTKKQRVRILAASMIPGHGDADDNRQWDRPKRRSGDCPVSHPQGYPLGVLALIKGSSSVRRIDSRRTGPFHPTNAQRARFVRFL